MAMDSVFSPCVDLVRQQDRDRFLTVQFAPSTARGGLYAVYALNQELGRALDTASEPLIARMRVQWWRDALDAILSGAPPGHPVARALGAVSGHLNREALECLLVARANASDARPPRDREALERALDETEGSLVRLALGVMGVSGPAAETAARHAGLTWGLTGLLRAIPHHAVRRRRWLPDTACEAENLSEEELFANRNPHAVAATVRTVAGWAHEHAATARENGARAPGGALPVLLPVVLAERHLSRLARAGYDPHHPVVGRPSGTGDVLRLIWRGWRGRI